MGLAVVVGEVVYAVRHVK